jgi:integrase/recombinase XerD
VEAGSPSKTVLSASSKSRDPARLHEAEQADHTVRPLCVTLTYAGCRLSETLTVDRIDLADGVLVFKA